MRDGRWIGEGSLRELGHDEIVRMMVGRDLVDLYKRSDKEHGTEVLRVEGVSLQNPNKPDQPVLDNISFSLSRGEVIGIFGLMGAGRTVLMESLFGLHSGNVTGNIHIDNKLQTIQSPADAIAAGLALAPEDRKREGLILEMSVAENTSLPNLPKMETYRFLDTRKERRHVKDSINRFNVKTPSIHQLVRNLSGGNQQKVILGKWLAVNPLVLLLDEPTRGIDINAKREIYTLIDELAREGLSVVMVSSELPEIMAVTDRILVLSEGHMTGEFSGDEVSEDALMKAALPHDPKPVETTP
jgi:ribose transport system ATP-binding protein